MKKEPGQQSDVVLETVAKRPSSAWHFETYRDALFGVLGKTRDAWPLLTAYERFEQVVSLILTALVSVLILATLVHLTHRIFRLVLFDLADPTQQEFFQTVFGMVMTVLIALEFNHSILSVLERRHGIVQVRTVVLVALLALVRKFILVDVTPETPAAVLGLAASVLALGTVYWLMREQDQREANADAHNPDGGTP
jgi:uncharacterized membrane protein (DUF373 family)